MADNDFKYSQEDVIHIVARFAMLYDTGKFPTCDTIEQMMSEVRDLIEF